MLPPPAACSSICDASDAHWIIFSSRSTGGPFPALFIMSPLSSISRYESRSYSDQTQKSPVSMMNHHIMSRTRMMIKAVAPNAVPGYIPVRARGKFLPSYARPDQSSIKVAYWHCPNQSGAPRVPIFTSDEYPFRQRQRSKYPKTS